MPNYTFQLPQLTHFVEFLRIENILLPHEFHTLDKLWQAGQQEKAELEGGVTTDEDLRKSAVMPILPGAKNDWLFERMTDATTQANQYYRFDLNGFYEPLQLAEYSEGDFFDWHLDFGTGASSNRKLSLTIQLSEADDYEGGDLEFRINNKVVKAPRERGTVLIFPSFIMHRVTKITKGKRRSVVGWVSGVPYR